MDLRAILLAAFAMPFAGVVVLAIINRRTLFGDPVEDITDYGADWPRVDPAFHDGAE